MLKKEQTRKYRTSDYTFVQCNCCNMAFHRRSSTIRGKEPLFYNGYHWERYKANSRKRVPLDKTDLVSSNCTTPGQTIVWRPEDPLPYVLLKSLIQ